MRSRACAGSAVAGIPGGRRLWIERWWQGEKAQGEKRLRFSAVVVVCARDENMNGESVSGSLDILTLYPRLQNYCILSFSLLQNILLCVKLRK